MKKFLIMLALMVSIVGCNSSNNNAVTADPDTLYYVVELDADKIVLAPKEYTKKSHEEFVDDFIEMPLALRMSYHDTTTSTFVDENGEQQSKLLMINGTVETITDAMTFECPYVFVECNEDNEVNKIILYGELAFLN